MITKEEFVDYLNFIYKQEEKQEQFVQALENLCEGNYCDCWLFSDYATKYIELLQIIMHDTGDNIRYFLYEMERGKSKYYQDAPFHNEEELYDYLIQRQSNGV